MKNFRFLALSMMALVLLFIPPANTKVMARDVGYDQFLTGGGPVVMPAQLAMMTLPGEIPLVYTIIPPQVSDPATVTEAKSFGKLLMENFYDIVIALLGLWELIARLTKTKYDVSIISWIMKVLNLFFPNRKSGGGVIPPLFKSQQ